MAEATAIGDDRIAEEFRPANRDAVAFPLRLLQLANHSAGSEGTVTFSELARMVGETKPQYNDQR